MQRTFLDFLEIQPRGEKPRKLGRQYVGEYGAPMSWLREMLDIYGDYVDHAKFAIPVLTVPWRVIEEKVKVYRDHDVEVGIDDPTFSVAYYQGKVKEFFRTVREV